MKKVLFGLGAVAATAYAAKKMIDKEMEKEYIVNLEKQWEDEANFESREAENIVADAEEMEMIFAESDNPDLSEGLWEKTKSTIKNVVKALPHITVTVNFDKDKEQK